MMAEFHSVPHALAVSNGTVALHWALISLGIGPGDEVIVPDLTFAATANAVLHAGATPLFVDVDPETWNIDIGAVEGALTKRTRAVMPVHLYGHPCEMDSLMALARQRNLLVIEDCAEALGARFKGQLVGGFGDAACYSFFGNKTLTTGEGGIILFRGTSVYDRARMLRDHGMSKERRYWHLEVGYNYRLSNLQAAIGVAQMERAESILARKRAVARQYNGALAVVPGIGLPPCASWADPVYWLYTIRLADDLGITRDDLANRLLLNGIETRPVFYPLHQMPPFKKFSGVAGFPVTDRLSRTGLSLPSAVTLRDEDIDGVAANVKAIIEVRQMLAVAESRCSHAKLGHEL
jgi:perosamine synthetase